MNTNTKTPSSFLALTVGIFIGALLVLPMFAYLCRVNRQLRQENQRLRTPVVRLSPLLQKHGLTILHIAADQMKFKHFDHR